MQRVGWKQMGLLMLLLWGGVSTAEANGVMVEQAWVREAPPGTMALAGYMTLHNHGDSPKMLVGAGSDAFASIMLHQTVLQQGMARMVHQHSITLPAGGMLRFEPNGYHLMLLKPKQPLRAGNRINVTLKFESGEQMDVEYEVRPIGGEDATGMHGMGEHNHH